MPETKPKVLIALLCGSERDRWINPGLVRALLPLQRDPRFEVEVTFVHDCFPVSAARNAAVDSARGKFDWLLMVDNDMTLPEKPCTILDILFNAGTNVDVLGLAAGVNQNGFMLNLVASRGITEGMLLGGVHRVGSGVIALRSSVWQKLPKGPWFKTTYADGEIGNVSEGEDWYFCRIAEAAGLKLWSAKVCAGHLHTVDLTPLAIAQTKFS